MATMDDMELGLLRHSAAHSTTPGEAQADEVISQSSRVRAKVQEERVYRRDPSKLLLQWIATIILVGLVVIIMVVHHTKGVLSAQEKSTYNILSTIFILVLGLSFFEAFKELAKAIAKNDRIRYRLCSQKEEMELFDRFENLLIVCKLVRVSSYWVLRIACLTWLLLNFGAQLLGALISLECTVNDGNDYNGTYTRHGIVRTSNLACYSHNGACAQPPTNFALAHAFGQQSGASECGSYDTIQDVIDSQYDYQYYCRKDGKEFAHRFAEYNKNDTQKSYPHFTKRIITVSAGDCITHELLSPPAQVPIKQHVFRNFIYGDKSDPESILIPTASLGLGGTTYIYPDSTTPAEASKWGKGPRGLRMLAYRNEKSPLFIECPITISNVSNTTKLEHEVPDEVARTAAASIALQGQWYQGTLENPDWKQYQFYAVGSRWEVHSHDPQKAGENMAESAIASLSAMIAENQPIYLGGTVPYLGSRLEVDWKAFSAILICIVATHTVVFGLTYFLASP